MDLSFVKHPTERTGSLKPLTAGDRIPGVRAAGSAAPRTEHERLTQQAQKWVAQTFFGTLLKQARQTPFKSDLLDGGRGGQAFGSLYDQHLAERMARGAGGKLVRSMVRQIEGRAAYQRQQAQKTSAGHSAYDGVNAAKNPAGATDRPRSQSEENNPFKNVRIHVARGLRA